MANRGQEIRFCPIGGACFVRRLFEIEGGQLGFVPGDFQLPLAIAQLGRLDIDAAETDRISVGTVYGKFDRKEVVHVSFGIGKLKLCLRHDAVLDDVPVFGLETFQ